MICPRLVSDPQLGDFSWVRATIQKGAFENSPRVSLPGDGRAMRVHRRAMKAAHAGLGITESDWQTNVKHFVATLDKFKVPQKENDELLRSYQG